MQILEVRMECVECDECGSIIKCGFRDCPYCDVQISKGRFWEVLSALTGNAALQHPRKNVPVLINLD
jgi:hypothetical protein